MTTPNLWSSKPWWCQPWSIVLTGVLIAGFSWLVLKTVWITIAVSAVILVWWLVFLVMAPAAYRQAIEQGLESDQSTKG